MPTAQMDFFSVCTQLCADHLISGIPTDNHSGSDGRFRWCPVGVRLPARSGAWNDLPKRWKGTGMLPILSLVRSREVSWVTMHWLSTRIQARIEASRDYRSGYRGGPTDTTCPSNRPRGPHAAQARPLSQDPNQVRVRSAARSPLLDSHGYTEALRGHQALPLPPCLSGVGDHAPPLLPRGHDWAFCPPLAGKPGQIVGIWRTVDAARHMAGVRPKCCVPETMLQAIAGTQHMG